MAGILFQFCACGTVKIYHNDSTCNYFVLMHNTLIMLQRLSIRTVFGLRYVF